MSGKVLGDYDVAPEVWDAMNYESGGHRYMKLTVNADGSMGTVYRDPQFMNFHPHNAADWAVTMGKEAIIVDLEDMLRLDWSELPVIRDTMDED